MLSCTTGGRFLIEMSDSRRSPCARRFVHRRPKSAVLPASPTWRPGWTPTSTLLCIAGNYSADDLLPESPANACRLVTDAQVLTFCVAQAIMGISLLVGC